MPREQERRLMEEMILFIDGGALVYANSMLVRNANISEAPVRT